MSTTIESLELEIQANSKSAVNGIEALSKSLETLKGVTSGKLGLSAVAKEIESFNKADVNGAKSKMVTLSAAISTLSNLPKVNLSGVINPLKNLPAALSGLTNTNMSSLNSGLQGLVSSLAPLSELPKQNLSGYINSLRKLPTVLEELNKVDMGAFAVKMQEVATAMKPLATEMEKVSNGFSAMPTKIQKLINATDKIPTSNKRAAGSFTDLFHIIQSGVHIITKFGSKIWSAVEKSMDYTENMNLFTVAMGEYAGEAMEYAESISDAMGIDTSEWIKAQGIFMTMATGFGVASDRAATMSKNLTQLGYDLSSFYNMDVKDAMSKLKSGLAGELEPLRAIGYDLSQAKLEATALELGITKSVSAMTQAEKAQLRYYAIMTQVTVAQGDMARTLNDPANQVRVFKAQINMAAREIGNAFIPALNAIIPYATAAAKVIGSLASIIAGLFGYKDEGVKESTMSVVENTDAVTENLEDAREEAKKLKSYMLGIDELNVINSDTDSATTDTSSMFDFKLPEYEFFDDELESKVNTIVEEMKEWLGITDDIDSWADLFQTKLGGILILVTSIGVALLAWKVIKGVANVLDVFSKFGGGNKSTDGSGGDIGGGVGKANTKLVSLAKNLGVGIAIIAEVAVAAGIIVGSIWGLGLILEQVGIAWQPVIDNGTTVITATTIGTVVLGTIGGLTAGLGTLGGTMCGQIGIGIGILAELGAATGLFILEIWAIGYGLDQIGVAWQPVLDNGGNIAITIGIGTGILVLIGAAAAGLGVATVATAGALPAAIGLGIAILAEMGAAVALFLVEIWAIGYGLDQIGIAWQPVLDNGEDIAIAIGIGTGLLVGVGIVTAALGVASVATVGALPLAIAAGTLLLKELATAFVELTDSLLVVAGQLRDKLHPALTVTSAILPILSSNMHNFTSFMAAFAREVVKYSANSAIASIASTIDKIIGFFFGNPVTNMAEEVESQNDEFDRLIKGLDIVLPKIDKATELVGQYNTAMGNFEEASGENSGLLGNLGVTANAINAVIGGIETLTNGVIKGINGMINALNSISFELPNWLPGDLGGKKFGLNLKTISTITLPRFAEGGFPEQGQMFIAREAGAEMVGSIGRRTAVANNDQIVSGIAGGVAEANEEQNALLREQNSLLRAILEKDSGVYLDGKNLTNSVEKYQRERGRVLISGGVL